MKNLLVFLIISLGIYSASAQCEFQILDHKGHVDLHCGTKDIVISEKIDGQTTVRTYNKPWGWASSLYVGQKIDGQSTLWIMAKGDCTINQKIDGQSKIKLYCGGKITINGEINGQSTLDLHAGKEIRLSGVNGQSHVHWFVDAGPNFYNGPNDGQSGIEMKENKTIEELIRDKDFDF